MQIDCTIWDEIIDKGNKYVYDVKIYEQVLTTDKCVIQFWNCQSVKIEL